MFRQIMAIWLMGCTLQAAGQTLEELQQTGRDFQRQGDYENAIVVFKRALEKRDSDPEIRQDLAISYYLARKYKAAIEVLQPLLNASKPDEQIYQLAGMIYRTDQDLREAEKLYKAGLKHYPSSGVLHNEYGELLEIKEPGQGKGIQWWEKGIEIDPKYSGNYYNAARYYANHGTIIWALLYGEIFVNLESFSNRTIDIKNLLYANYKKAFTYGMGKVNEKNPFENMVANLLQKQHQAGLTIINPETLTAIRTRFILDWYHTQGDKYPFRLFERHRNMLREGLFEAYNQWLFGGAANISAFQNWTKQHAEAYQAFNQYQRNKLFNVVKGEYYK